MGDEDDIEAIIANIANDPGSFTWSTAPDNDNYLDFKIVADEYSDYSFGISQDPLEKAIYTSYEQREQHDKYPALQKAWEDYLAMYALTKGEPPIV